MILYMILSKRSLPTGSFLVITKPLLKLRMCKADWMCMITDDMETALKQMGRRKKAGKALGISKWGSTYASRSLCILCQYS